MQNLFTFNHEIMRKKPHHMEDHMGYNISRVREIFGYQQNELAAMCGWSQQQMSKIELSAEVEESIINQVAEVLNTRPEVIKNFKDDHVVFLFSNTYNDDATDNSQQYYRSTIHHPIEQVTAFFERMLAQEKQKLEQLSQFSQVVIDLAAQVTSLTAQMTDLAARVERLKKG